MLPGSHPGFWLVGQGADQLRRRAVQPSAASPSSARAQAAGSGTAEGVAYRKSPITTKSLVWLARTPLRMTKLSGVGMRTRSILVLRFTKPLT